MRKPSSKNRNQGVALLACLLALMLLTAIALGLMYLGDTESRTNDNFRSSQQAYFASMAGLQNVRERMTLANVAPHQIVPPTAMPGNANSVLYVLNPAGMSDAVAPATVGSSYYDQELCQEMAAQHINCPLASNNTVTTAENGPPYLNTAAAVPYKWVRINRKANASDAPYYNNGSSGNSTLNTQVCWNGVSELPVTLLPVTDCTLSAGSDPPRLERGLRTHLAGGDRQWLLAPATDGGGPGPAPGYPWGGGFPGPRGPER